jgi:hypothetical protein
VKSQPPFTNDDSRTQILLPLVGKPPTDAETFVVSGPE